ncbi:hypothetical protein KBX21_20430 [Nocardiopsis sp. B62]|nr:hypothetical protein [Nocardiopsis sp. B62]
MLRVNAPTPFGSGTRHRLPQRTASKHHSRQSLRSGSGPSADDLVAEIQRVLDNPGRPAHATRTLARADLLFSELDRLVISGGLLPTTWRASSHPFEARVRHGIAHEYATQCYDTVSEELRETGGVVVAWRALRAAARAWERLDRALTERAPLPEPWNRE